LNNVEEGDTLYTKLTEYSSYSIPVRTEMVDVLLNDYVYMIYYDSLLWNIETKELTVYLDNDYNESTLSDLTNVNIIEITVNNFVFEDSTNIDNYRKLPYHYHKLKEIDDIDINTNNENGYIKLNNSKLELDFP